jgi:arylsulfatase A
MPSTSPRGAGFPWRPLALLLCAALPAFLARRAPAAGAAAPRPPNIVLILADDLGYAELGCYGQQKIRTPSLDRMAAGGMRFTHFYSGSPVCAPSRSTLMTGKHTGHTPIRNNSEVQPEGQRPMPDAAVTVAELLKKRGYATGATGKWGLGFPGSEGDPNRQGFDLFFGYNCQRHAHNHYPRYLRRNGEKVDLEGNDAGLTGKQFSHDLMEAEALKFVRENRERPFFLYVPFTIPHLALQVPEDSLAEYRGKWEDPAYEGGNGYLPHPHPRAAYAAMVTRMDRSVGRIMDLLKELKLDERTLVLFSSDNGPTYNRLGGSDSDFFQSAGPFRGFKGSVYEGGIRVPLIARWPGRIRAGATSDLPAALWDLLPTFTEAAGAETPADVDGVSLLPTLLGRDGQKRREYLYWEFPAYGGQQAVRLGDWKGVRQNLMRAGRREIELYHLREDPGEKRDVAAAHPETVARIARIMREGRTPSPMFPFPALDSQ